MQGRIQQAVEEVLAIERQAETVIERARGEARSIRERAGQMASAAREEALAGARREAGEIVASARAVAERERDRRLAEAATETGEWEHSAQSRFEAAVRFAVARLLGEPTAEAAGPGADERRRAA